MSETRDELQVQIQYGLMENLSKTQQRQAKLIELLQQCIFECDHKLELTYVNQAWSQRLGYATEGLLGKSLLFFVHDAELLQKLASADTSALQAILGAGCELQIRSLQGELIWFELRLIENPDGGFIGSLFDIHSHKNIEAQLRQQEEAARRLSLVASHTNNLVVITDRSGRIEWVNQSFEKFVGYSAEEVIGLQPGSFLQGPDTDLATVALMSNAVNSGQPFKVELVNYTRVGSPYWVAVDASPVHDEHGEVTHFIAIETDISERVAAEQKASENEDNYRSVVDNISEVVLRLDSDGSILYVNQAWRYILGRNESECLGLNITDFICSGDINRVREALDAYRSGSRSVCKLDLKIKRQGGSSAWAEMTMTPLQAGRRGTRASIAATLIDVDKRVAANKLLRDAKQQAEQLADQKSRFLANISHEIRTPLNAVIGAADILQETGLTREQERYTGMIRTSGDALLSILDDVLHYSRFEAGGITLESRSFDLGACIEEAIDIVSESGVSKGLGIVLDVAPDVPLLVVGDNNRLRQVIVNLLANAIKFTEQGEISIRASHQSISSDGFGLTLIFQDTGIGIKPDQLQRMFEPFVQSDVSSTRKFGGSGLGLAICKQICLAVGGDISVESEIGVGSTFVVKFPLGLQQGAGLHAPVGQGVEADFRVWVVGGDTVINRALGNLLRRYKFEFASYSDIEALPIHESEADFIVLTDALQAAACRDLLNPQLVLNPPCLLVLDLLGTGRVVQIINRHEVRLNGPFKLSHLPLALESLEEQIGATNPGMDAEDSPLLEGKLSYQGKTVLVVEDNQANQIIVTQFLKHRGCHVLIAPHGVAALKELASSTVDLVLMDIQMPVMDGMTTTQHIRSSGESYNSVPIVAVTADALYGDRERYLSAGMNGYLSKPLSRELLYQCLDPYLLSEVDRTSGNEKLARLRAAMQLLADSA